MKRAFIGALLLLAVAVAVWWGQKPPGIKGTEPAERPAIVKAFGPRAIGEWWAWEGSPPHTIVLLDVKADGGGRIAVLKGERAVAYRLQDIWVAPDGHVRITIGGDPSQDGYMLMGDADFSIESKSITIRRASSRLGLTCPFALRPAYVLLPDERRLLESAPHIEKLRSLPK